MSFKVLKIDVNKPFLTIYTEGGKKNERTMKKQINYFTKVNFKLKMVLSLHL